MVSEVDSAKTLLSAIKDEAARLQEDALCNYASHYEEARCRDYLHRWLGVSTTLLAAVAGVASFSNAGGNVSNGFWSSVVAGAVSFGVAALAGLTTFLDPKSHADEHNRAANGYWVLQSDARYLRLVQSEKETQVVELEIVLVSLRRRLTKLNDNSPLLSEKAVAKALTKVYDNYYQYLVDKEQHVPKGLPSPSPKLN